MINYFNFKKFGNQFLITNDAGRYAFVSSSTLHQLITNDEQIPTDDWQNLIDNYFVYDSHPEVFAEQVKPYVRNTKSYLFNATSLFIFVLTNECNLNCVYCQAKDENNISYKKMDHSTAEKCVDFALSSPSKYLTFEFQGGEPLVNFDVIKHIIMYTEENKKGKIVSFSLVSNLILLNESMENFLISHNVSISTSLDGPLDLHNKNRSDKTGKGSYSGVKKRIEQLMKKGIVPGAIQTTTRSSLEHAKAIVDEYVSLGQKSLFLRPLTCLGTAKRVWKTIGYTSEEFLSFYKECIDYMLLLNTRGIDIIERHASIFLKKILFGESENYMELRSPCGASVGQMAFFYDGNIFTCDEARMLYEMGNASFMIGNVTTNSYNDVMNNPTVKATSVASMLEGQLNCSDCVYQPYCGTCPVINLACENDISVTTQNSFRCQIYSGILDILFTKLSNGSAEEIENLKKWAR